MRSAILFHLIFWALLLTPGALLVFIWRRNEGQDIVEAGDGLQSTRWFGVVCCAMPILRMALELLPTGAHQQFVYLNVFLLFAAVLAGVAGTVLYAINAKGIERIVGPMACVGAFFLSLILFFGGMTAV
jgi:hypothetical protein